MFLFIGTPVTDASGLQSKLAEAKMATDIVQRMMQHRRSSIPFANRSPTVRFLRGAKQNLIGEAGPCSPIIGGSNQEVQMVKKMKSILKRNEHPILINTDWLSDVEREELNSEMTNDLLGNCKDAVDQATQRLYTAERQARGAIDIVTFPVAYSVVEPFSRFLGTVLLCIEALDIVRKQDHPKLKDTNSKVLKEISSAIQDFMYIAMNCEQNAKKLVARCEDVYKQWTAVMKIKSEFYIDHAKINTPVYQSKTMPENVTLYEDVRDEDERYLYDGVLTLALVKDVFCVWADLSNEGSCLREAFINMSIEQQCEIIITLVRHSKDLVFHSSKYISNALRTLTDKDYSDIHANVKKRVTDLTFDDFFDPLCGLDLKNSFGEVVERKTELLNLSKHLYQNVISTRKLITKFHGFTMQIVKGEPKAATNCLPCCSTYYTRETLLAPFRSITEVAVNVPMSNRFQHIVFTPSTQMSIEEAGKDIVSYARGSADSIAGDFINNIAL